MRSRSGMAKQLRSNAAAASGAAATSNATNPTNQSSSAKTSGKGLKLQIGNIGSKVAVLDPEKLQPKNGMLHAQLDVYRDPGKQSAVFLVTKIYVASSRSYVRKLVSIETNQAFGPEYFELKGYKTARGYQLIGRVTENDPWVYVNPKTGSPGDYLVTNIKSY
jgi:hypothetical protein